MADFASRLHDALAAVAPITGISIGSRNDRSTWRIDFAPEATPQQQSAANALLASFDPQSTVDDDIDTVQIPPKVLAAILVAIQTIPAQRPAWVTNTLQRALQRLQDLLAGRTPTS